MLPKYYTESFFREAIAWSIPKGPAFYACWTLAGNLLKQILFFAGTGIDSNSVSEGMSSHKI
jgi:hypothetical protein